MTYGVFAKYQPFYMQSNYTELAISIYYKYISLSIRLIWLSLIQYYYAIQVDILICVH